MLFGPNHCVSSATSPGVLSGIVAAYRGSARTGGVKGLRAMSRFALLFFQNSHSASLSFRTFRLLRSQLCFRPVS